MASDQSVSRAWKVPKKSLTLLKCLTLGLINRNPYRHYIQVPEGDLHHEETGSLSLSASLPTSRSPCTRHRVGLQHIVCQGGTEDI